MASFSPLVEGFNITLKCKKQGHQSAPLVLLCTIPSCKEHLFC